MPPSEFDQRKKKKEDTEELNIFTKLIQEILRALYTLGTQILLVKGP